AHEKGGGGVAIRRGGGRSDRGPGARRRRPLGPSRDPGEALVSARGDGRNIDPEVGVLEGEAADQEVPEERQGREGAIPDEVWSEVPGRDGQTYFDRPVLKEPVWVWAVPAYFYAGGTAGAAATLGAAAQLLDRDELDGLVRRCRWIAAAGTAIGTALLVE